MRDYLSKAINDLPPGEDLGEGVTDHTHLLPENLRNKGYELRSMDYIADNGTPAVHMAAAHTTGGKKVRVGTLAAGLGPSVAKIHLGEVDREHRNQGLGMAMYEAMLSHLSKKHGIKRVRGGNHSSMVRSLHQKLAEKHGMTYHAGPAYDSYDDIDEWRRTNHSYDDKYGPYSYTIKEELPMAVKKNESNLAIPGRFRPKYERNLHGWMELEPLQPTAMEQLGCNANLQKHIDAAARMLGFGTEISLKKCRLLLNESESLGEAVLRAFNAYTPENEDSLQLFINDSELLKDELDLGSGLAAYKITPVRMEATETADAVQRAIDSGYINPVKLGGKHSKGSMLAKDPQTKVVYLLKPGSGKNSPAAGVNEDPSSQSEREVAFWHVAKALGLEDSFPRADLILVNGHQTAALELLPFSFANLGEKKRIDRSLPTRILEQYRNNTTLFKWSLIDYILGNPDRHSQNIMVDPENKIVRLIDHGSAFAGQSFSPSDDDNSFIPYYLRAWTDRKFTQMDPKTRIRYMPTLGGRAEQTFDEWVKQVNGKRIAAVLEDYNIDPRPALARLAKVLAMPGPKWAVLNKLWAGTI